MQYLLATYEIEEDFEKRSSEDATDYWAGWETYTVALEEAGVLKEGRGLKEPWTATTVRLRDGRKCIHDGPFSETHEQLAGYYVIEVPNLDVALLWAAKAPCAKNGSVEVRPIYSGKTG